MCIRDRDSIVNGPVSKHIETVMNGVSGTAMQAFKSQLSPVEIASVITFERNSWGNHTGTMVQPIQIKAYHDGKSIDDALATKPGAAPTTPAAPAVTPGATAPAAAAPAAAAPAAPSVAPAPSAAPITGTAPLPTAPAAPTTPAAPSTPAVTVPPPAGAPAPAAPTAPAPTTMTAPATSTTPTTSAAPTTGVTTPATTTSAAPSPDALKAAMARGEKVYLNTCAACHQVAGTGMPPTFPALKGSPIATGPVAEHLNRVLNGKTGTAMQAFKDQFNDQDLADVITYERNAWGNNTGTLVTADQVKAARQLPPTN